MWLNKMGREEEKRNCAERLEGDEEKKRKKKYCHGRRARGVKVTVPSFGLGAKGMRAEYARFTDIK